MLIEFQNRKIEASEAKKLIASDAVFRSEIAQLASKYLQIKVAGCNTCYFDAWVKLMLKKDTTMSKFKLRSGALLRDTIFRKCGNTSKHNLTDEKALYFLSVYPDLASKFTVIPKDVDKMLKNFDIDKMQIIEPVIEKKEIKDENRTNKKRKKN